MANPLTPDDLDELEDELIDARRFITDEKEIARWRAERQGIREQRARLASSSPAPDAEQQKKGR